MAFVTSSLPSNKFTCYPGEVGFSVCVSSRYVIVVNQGSQTFAEKGPVYVYIM